LVIKMVSLFDTLLKQKAKGDKTPTEDFFTEIFTHLLNNNRGIFINWLHYFSLSDLDPDESDIKIATQETFGALEQHSSGSRPDVVIEVSDDKRIDVIFIESKIDSHEGEGQLKKYAEQLDRLSSINQATLVYVTRDYEKKDEKEILINCRSTNLPKFKQLRWHEIYNFLKKYREESYLVNETIRFMEINNMAHNNQFSSVDILTLTNFPRVRRMMDETMKGEVSKLFKKVTGGIAQDSTLLTQLRDSNRYVYQLWQQEDMWCGYGYWFDPSNIANYPDVGVILESYPNSPERDIIIAAMKEIANRCPDKWKGYDLTATKAWSGIWQLKSLKDFMPEENQVGAISSFFKEGINDLEAIKTEYPGLPWNK